MVDANRALLDELMGLNRNKPIEGSSSCDISNDWRDRTVCKYYLMGFCPNQYFINTRPRSMEPCALRHIDTLKSAFEAESPQNQYKYELDLLRLLQDLIHSIENRKRFNAERSSANGDNENKLQEEQLSKRLQLLQENESTLKSEIAKAPNSEPAAKMKELASSLEGEMLQIQGQLSQLRQAALGKPKPMLPCDVCGCLMNERESAERISGHREGKQHTGMILVREMARKLQEKHRELKHLYIGLPEYSNNHNSHYNNRNSYRSQDYRRRSRSRERHYHRDSTASHHRRHSSRSPSPRSRDRYSRHSREDDRHHATSRRERNDRSRSRSPGKSRSGSAHRRRNRSHDRTSASPHRSSEINETQQIRGQNNSEENSSGGWVVIQEGSK
jgi:hypothetical protein